MKNRKTNGSNFADKSERINRNGIISLRRVVRCYIIITKCCNAPDCNNYRQWLINKEPK